MSLKRVYALGMCVVGCLALAGGPAVAGRGGGGGGGGGGNQQNRTAGRGGGGGRGGSADRGRQGGARGSRARGGTRGAGRYGTPAGRGGANQYQQQYQHQYRHGQGQGPGLGEGRQHRWQYNHGEEQSIRGTVVEESGQGQGRGTDKSILVRTDDGARRRVQLGPPWYADGLGIAPRPGDTVEFIGAAHGESGAVQARQMNWNGHTYRFRNQEGAPLWAGADREEWSRYAGAWGHNDMEEITGEIEGIDGIAPGRADMGRGVVLRLRARERNRDGEGGQSQERSREQTRERHRVHLGPYWHVEDGMPGLGIGQEVTVRGVPVDMDGERPIMATEMVRNQDRVRLRTREGQPEWAGGWQNWDGWGPGSRYSGMYDPERVQTRAGVVEGVEEVTPMGGMGRGLALTVRTRERERTRVHLAPSWFAEQSDLIVNPGESVAVTGSVVEMNGKQVLMAREMTQANRRVRLRERDGTPVWSGRGPDAEAQEAEPE